MASSIRPYVCRKCMRQLQNSIPSSPSCSLTFQRLQIRYNSSTAAPRDRRTFRLAVIGSGPAGFYTAYKVMSKIENTVVDMYEHLPVPFGLVRFGVAPDHPEVKNCKEKFTEVAESPNFNFIGNIAVGSGPQSLSLKALAPNYDAILFAYGASKDRTLGITGEDRIKDIYSARAFVGWYNGLPEYTSLAPNLSAGDEAVIIGQGNVALDVARILLSDIDTLRKTDITESAVESLAKSRIKRIHVVGRRGPMQAAFTIKEVRELMNLSSVAFDSIDASLIPPDLSALPRAPRRIMQVLTKGSATSDASAEKKWSLDFQLSPTSFNADASNRLESVSFEKTQLEPDAFELDAKAVGTGAYMNLPASAAFRSIGYKSEALEGLSDISIPFDNRLGIIPNDQLGRVLRPTHGPGDPLTARHVPGMYCAGWVKRGPTGVIASTMNDAFATAEAISEDWHSDVSFITTDSTGHKVGWEGLKSEAEQLGLRRVSWQDWTRIDAAERQKGQAKGKEREKFTNIEDMLAVLN